MNWLRSLSTKLSLSAAKSPATNSATEPLAEAEFPVSEALILICEKCGRKLSSDPNQNPAKALQQELKQKIMLTGQKGKWRAALTGCVDLCPNGKIAVGIAAAPKSQVANQFFVLENHTEGAVQAIFEKLKVPTAK